MTSDEFEQRLDRAFSKRIRIAAENQRGQFSSHWMFWGNKSDFYFGAKELSGEFKVSLHENGRGYVAYDKQFFQRKRDEGVAVPAKTLVEWVLPKPSPQGAVHAASLLLPADYFHGAPLGDSARKNTLMLGIEDGCCAEVGVFLSHEDRATLETKLETIGKPMFEVTLENGVRVSLVSRSRPFDRTSLPSTEQVSKSVTLRFEAVPDNDDLNAILWNKPVDGGALQCIDIGGVGWRNHPVPQPAARAG